MSEFGFPRAERDLRGKAGHACWGVGSHGRENVSTVDKVRDSER